MRYDEIVEMIQSKRRFGQACGREVTQEMMGHLGYPEDGMKIIHIAGTNGKGSTAAFVSSILQAADFVVGKFTSPHLIRFTERITINDVEISQEDVIRLGEQILGLPMSLEMTMFDVCLGIAILYFKEQKCDYVVLETGLGGTKDSTSGLRQVPLVSAITNIGLEHTAILGNTIEKIAREKAGIIKPGTELVLGIMDPKAHKVIEEVAKSQCVNCRNVDNLLEKISTYKIGLNGGFQRENAALAMGIVETIFHHECGYLVDELIRKGIEEASWPGRMEILQEKPYVMVDGAHNPQGVEALFNSLISMFPDEKFVFITGVMADKDYSSMMKTMLPIASCFYTVTVDTSRSLPAEELASQLQEMGAEAFCCDSFPKALEFAYEREGNRIVIFGSLYFVGQVKSFFI